MMHGHSDAVVLLHFVWATLDRVRVLAPDHDAWLMECLRHAAQRIWCDTIGVGVALDHVHCVVHLGRCVSIADLAQRLKGVSARYWNERPGMKPLRWQQGYWVRSIEPESLATLLPYLRHQRKHHARNTERAAWEFA
jgi:REP element-mobilizing transposase RayT